MFKFRTKIIKDTSKRNLLTRIEKRERFLAYAYIRGEFELPEDRNPRNIRLKFPDVDFNNPLDKAMCSLLNKVNWFALDKERQANNETVYINAPSKKYMRFLYKRVFLTRSKGMMYLYSPVTMFAWLSAPSTKYLRDVSNSEKLAAIINVWKSDVNIIQEWFKTLFQIEITADVNPDTPKRAELFISPENLSKMLELIKNDKFCKDYYDLLIDYMERF